MSAAADPAAPLRRAGTGATIALTVGAATMFAVQYATQAIHPVIGRDLAHGPAITGLTISVVIAGVALGSWLLGPLSDRIGRRRVMVGSCLLLVIPSALIAVAPDMTWLLILRALQGLLLPGLLSVAIIYIYEAFPADRVPTIVGYYTASLIAGGFLGRTIPAALTGPIGWRGALAVLALPVLLSAILMRVALPEIPRVRSSRSTRAAIGAHLRNKPLVLNAFTAGLVFLAFVGLFSVVAYRLESPLFGLTSAEIGLVYIVWFVGISTPLVGRLAGQVGATRIYPYFPVAAVVGLVLAGSGSLVVVIIGLAVFAAALFATVTLAQLLVPLLVPEDRGSAMSLYLTIYYLLGSAGPFLLGFAWDRAGWLGAAGLAAAALLVAFVGAVILRVRGPKHRPAAKEETDPVLS